MDTYGAILSIGENDGETFSNVYALILSGWEKAVMVEPSPKPFSQLQELYKDWPLIYCLNVAISDHNGHANMYDSGTHLHNGDTGLLTTINDMSYNKWKDTTGFNVVETELIDVKTLLKLSPFDKFQCISIDAEGEDLNILRQLNLKELDCQLLCIEHNGDKLAKDLIKTYCANHGLKKILLDNAENIILIK